MNDDNNGTTKWTKWGTILLGVGMVVGFGAQTVAIFSHWAVSDMKLDYVVNQVHDIIQTVETKEEAKKDQDRNDERIKSLEWWRNNFNGTGRR